MFSDSFFLDETTNSTCLMGSGPVEFKAPTQNMMDDFEFSEMLGHTINYNDLHDILISILKI